MKISVVIPVYNEELYIRRCLEAVTTQEDVADEIIIIDNNCTDKTIEIASQFNVKIVKEAEQGICAARNAGFNVARYDIIARTDADTIVPSDWIKKIRSNFESSPIDALGGPFVYYELPIRTSLFSNIFYGLIRVIQTHNTLIGFNMAIKKQMWNTVKSSVCHDVDKIHEDIDLAIHVDKKNGKIKYDRTLIVRTSARRMLKKSNSFFIEYFIRLCRTLYIH